MEYDFIVIGAGIAGASAGFELAARGRTVVLEQERQPGYHTTGRSAAMFAAAYGSPLIRSLTAGARSFFYQPPAGFADHPLLSPRGALFVGCSDQIETLDKAAAEVSRLVPDVNRLDGEATRRLVPVLRRDYVAGAVFEPGAMEVDVHSLHQGFLRGLKARGGALACKAEVTGLERRRGIWEVATPAGRYSAPVVINAAGAWCDQVAALCGAAPIGLVPKRRTVIIFAPPPGIDIDGWPLVVDIDEQFYFRPDAGRILGSPADETPSPPCDAQPEELDVAIAVDRIQRVSDLEVGRIEGKWAGLRSFVTDKNPVVGYDQAIEGFFWLAGQGGYGIQTSPSMGRLCASLITDGCVPTDLAELGVTESALSPARLPRN